MCRKLIYLACILTLLGMIGYALAQIQVRKAHHPSPADGVTDVSTDVVISWMSGLGATGHDVYLGADEAAVTNATTSSPEYMGSYDVNSYDPEGLKPGRIYYWRIDELNKTITKGDVWSFTTVSDKVTLIGHFLAEGAPYQCDVEITDGIHTQLFENVTDLEAKASKDSTCAISYRRGRWEVLSDFFLPIDAGGTLEMDFFLIDPDTETELRECYLLAEEHDASVTISSTYDEETNTLNVEGEAEPGKLFRLGVCVDEDQFPPNWVLTDIQESGTTTPGKAGQCNSQRKHITEGSWYCWHRLNHENALSVPGGADKGKFSLTYRFTEIGPDEAGVRVRRVLHNGVIVDYHATLTSITDPTKSYYPICCDPQFIVPIDDTFTLDITIPDPLPDMCDSISLPINVSAGGLICMDVYLPSISDLQFFDGGVLAEYGFANSELYNVFRDPNTVLSAQVSTENNYDWWPYFVIPPDHSVKTVYAIAAGLSTELEEGSDYTVSYMDTDNDGIPDECLIVVRATPSTEELIVDYLLPITPK